MRTLVFVLVFIFSFSTFAAGLCDPQNGGAALVIIDMQPYFAKRNKKIHIPENAEKVESVIAAQIELIRKAKAKNIPIIFFEYDTLDADKTTSRLKNEVLGYSGVKYLKKTTDGMFDPVNIHYEDVAKAIKVRKLGTLIVMGANGGACVQQSIRNSLKENCNVVAYSKGIVDFNYDTFIYPYQGKYSDLDKNKRCKGCTFTEESDPKKVISAMDVNKYYKSAWPSSGTTPSGTK